jgi:hypothetical protein
MPPGEDVLDGGGEQLVDEQQPAGDKGGKGGKEPETITLSKADHARLVRERDEAVDSERRWSEQFRTGRGRQDPVVEEHEEEEEEEIDEATDTIVDDFSAKGVKALVDRGLLTKKDARTLIRKEAEKIAREVVGDVTRKATADTTIMTKFPELKDPKSELYQQTRIELQEMVDLDPSAAKSPTALYAAAKAAKATLSAKASKTRTREEDRYDYEGDGDDDEEATRRLRADSQGASRGRGARTAADDDALPPKTREVLAGMFPDKTEEERLKIFRRGQGRAK